MEKRRGKYEAAADIVIKTDGKDKGQICEELAKRLRDGSAKGTGKILYIRKRLRYNNGRNQFDCEFLKIRIERRISLWQNGLRDTQS